MSKNRLTKLFFGMVSIILIMACEVPGLSQATPTLEPTNTPKPTNTPVPSKTPKPSATPDVVATQEMESVLSDIQKFYDEGYLDTTEGELYYLDDFYKEVAKMNYINFGWAGYDDAVKDFVVWGDVAWESAAKVQAPEVSGCGYAFRVSEEGDSYTALLTQDNIYMGYCDSTFHACGNIGKTRGSGRLNFSDGPARASMILIVRNGSAYVYVDNKFIGEYTLLSDRVLNPGAVLYGMISGTNRDYGTRCEVTNSRLWVIE